MLKAPVVCVITVLLVMALFLGSAYASLSDVMYMTGSAEVSGPSYDVYIYHVSPSRADARRSNLIRGR